MEYVEQAKRKWYVFDQYDCWNDFDSPVEAAKFAQDLAGDGECGVHIAYMTDSEMTTYCISGKFPFADYS